MNFLKWILLCSSFILIPLWINEASTSDITPDDRGYIVKTGDQVENFSVNLIDGTEKYLIDFKAKVIILNFFASWCSVCRKEIPYVEKKVWQQFKNRNVVVLGIDFKENIETTNKFVTDMKITYPVALDTAGTIFSRFAKGGVTRNVVLDENLKIIYLTRLFNKDEFERMLKIIKLKIEKPNLIR